MADLNLDLAIAYHLQQMLFHAKKVLFVYQNTPRGNNPVTLEKQLENLGKVRDQKERRLLTERVPGARRDLEKDLAIIDEDMAEIRERLRVRA